MTGGSAIKVADQVKSAGLNTTILCADPWTGDVNMWDWHKNILNRHGWDFLLADKYGIPRIYETFLANVAQKKHEDIILPLRATSIVSIRLLARLHETGRLPYLPQVIYLDSAHEKDETLMELKAAWSILAKGGVLWGDDWKWPAIRNAVGKFMASLKLPRLSHQQVSEYTEGAQDGKQPFNGLILSSKQWIILKPER
eukprot:gnl/TRDRNA2_/TRDRNA2_133140_c1_seq1.p1 gnl/TRDRNA2_/TRDRNA2_133140_c1~~gnl/TRDRNA2_/TRDRNA2_133140_c1_seq1.p1  ORF type:complete len:198 (-),score=11.60 gnl/TRDRNA2_/TRDRNA2_133140_c1_seq1:90-683(-)